MKDFMKYRKLLRSLASLLLPFANEESFLNVDEGSNPNITVECAPKVGCLLYENAVFRYVACALLACWLLVVERKV